MAASVDEELEYHVTFPTPTPDTDDAGDTLDEMLRKAETAVLLIGWMGSQDKYVAKYSKIWEDKGCTTVRYSPKKEDLIGERAKIIAKKLLEVLVEMNLAENPVLFHVFSNGGCIIYHEMRKELEANPSLEQIQRLGVIYDSCPGRPKLSTGIDVLFSRHPQNILTTLLKGLAYGFGWLLMGLDHITKIVGISIAPATIYDHMMFARDDCPELYLYSKQDSMFHFQDIEHMIERRRMQSVEISTKCWDNGQHVALYKAHPEGYKHQCYNFITQCLQRSAELLG